jgi:uncharacterized protein (DUF58 family)
MSLARYLKPEVIQKIARLDIQAKCIVEGFLSGLHRSPFHGFSTEFSEHRKYVEGDDVKYIDWNVYGKTERYYIKKYEAQTNLECMLLVDISKSMAYRYDEDGVSKLDYAIYLAAALSYLMIKQQDAVGLVTFDNDLRAYIRPQSKRKQLSAIVGQLAAAKTAEPTSFTASLAKIGGLLRHRGLVVILSDFLGDLDGMFAGLEELRYRGNDVIVFHILDRAELDLPFRESALFVDTESPDNRVAAEPDRIRQLYQEEIQSFVSDVGDRCLALRIQHLALDTSQAFDAALHQFLQERKSFC